MPYTQGLVQKYRIWVLESSNTFLLSGALRNLVHMRLENATMARIFTGENSVMTFKHTKTARQSFLDMRISVVAAIRTRVVRHDLYG